MRTMNMQKKLRKRGTNVSLDQELVAEAKSLGVNMSQSCERGLAAAVKAEKERRWLEDNREAIESWNRYLADHGVPLAKHRMF